MRASSTDPRDRVQHAWSCASTTRTIVETIERRPTGQAEHVLRCTACGGTDEKVSR